MFRESVIEKKNNVYIFYTFLLIIFAAMLTNQHDNIDWRGGNRAFFDPESPLKEVCSKCGGWGYTMRDGMPKPCLMCESSGFITLAIGATAVTVAAFKKLIGKR